MVVVTSWLLIRAPAELPEAAAPAYGGGGIPPSSGALATPPAPALGRPLARPLARSGQDVCMDTFMIYKNIYFELALGRPLGGSWLAGLGLEMPPKTIAFTSLNLSPIGCT